MPELLIATRETALADVLEAPMRLLDTAAVRRARPRSLPRILEDPEAVDALVLEIVPDPREVDCVVAQVRKARPKLPLLAIFPPESGQDAKRIKAEFQLHNSLMLPLEPFQLLSRLTRLVRAS